MRERNWDLAKVSREYEKEAISMLTERGCLLHLLDLLRYHLAAGDPEERLERGYTYLREICLSHGEGGTDAVWSNYREWELYLDHELLKKCRTAQGLSQEEVSGDICNRETLSRIENKRQAVTEKSFGELANLATYLEETGNYEEALKVCEEGIQLGLEADKGNIMQRFLTTRACVLEDMEKKEESIQEFTKAYYISLLYLDEHTAGLIREHLREKYEISL